MTYEPNVIYRVDSYIYLMDPSERWWILIASDSDSGFTKWMHGRHDADGDMTHVEFYVEDHKCEIIPVRKGPNVESLRPHLWRFVDPIGQEYHDHSRGGTKKGENYQIFVNIDISWVWRNDELP